MRTSPAGLELIKTFEGLRETAVRLPDGRWTIGYGHVRTAREGLSITAADAETLLIQDLRPIEAAISTMVFAPLMQNQFDALVSLAYNISLGQFRESEIVSHLNAGNHLAAANAFDLWRRARLHGRVMVVDALVRRRAAEKSLFLDHPSGPPSAPTPMVQPEMDIPGDTAPRESRPAPPREEPESTGAGHSAAASDEIADAVRRLAERMQGAVAPAPELPLPPGAVVVPETAPDPQPEPANDVAPATVASPASEPAHGPETPPVTARQLAAASRTMAERVSRILKGVETRIAAQEVASQAPPVSPSQAGAGPEPAAQRATVKPAAPVREVREGLPDFDLPPETYAVDGLARSRRLIDDTEIVEPGRDPSQLFAEAERRARVVNGQSRRIGPISGRLLIMAPWIVVFALSVLGFVIGAVEAFKDNGVAAGVPRLAATLMAVFGIMTLMSLYYLFVKRSSDDA